MAVVTIARSSAGQRPLTTFVPLSGDAANAATSATYTLAMSAQPSFSIRGTLTGTGFTYAGGDTDALPATGSIASIAINTVLGLPVLEYTITFPTPIAAADFAAASGNLTALLYGGADSMLGAAFEDSLSAHDGNDTLDGAGGADTLDGGAGNDSVIGGLGNDSILGGAGNDTLRPAAGIDTVRGGAGDDVLVVSETNGTDLFDGGADLDTLSVAVGGVLVADLTGATLTGLETLSLVSGVARLTTAQFTAFDTLALRANGAVNTVQVRGGGGIDLDAFAIAPSTATGLRLVLLDAAGPAPAFAVLGRSAGLYINDDIRGSSAADAIAGQAGADTLAGNGGADLILGGADADRLTGGEGADTLDGGTEADVLLGEAGADTLAGDGGDDSILGGEGADLIFGGDGADTITGGGGLLFADTIFGGAGADSITGGMLTGIAGPGLTLLLGEGGADTLVAVGNLGSLLDGGADNDLLTGSSESAGPVPNPSLETPARDTLLGGSGNDTLTGGAGSDQLQGDGGADIFRYTAADLAFPTIAGNAGQSPTDTIRDFNRAEGDRIDLSGIDANKATVGDDAFTAPVAAGGTPAVRSITYELEAGQTRLLLNTDADATPELIINVLVAGYVPVASDFIL